MFFCPYQLPIPLDKLVSVDTHSSPDFLAVLCYHLLINWTGGGAYLPLNIASSGMYILIVNEKGPSGVGNQFASF